MDQINRLTDLLLWVSTYRDRHGQMPTQTEIATGLGISRPTVRRLLLSAEGRGLVILERTDAGHLTRRGIALPPTHEISESLKLDR